MTKYTKASPPAKKMSLFPFIIITIILSYAMIRIYIILHIYLQVCKTEVGRTALEKINSIHFHGVSLAFSRMLFEECEFAVQNPNVVNIEAS